MEHDNKKINEISFMVKDLIQGDESVAERELFNEADIEDLQKGFNILVEKVRKAGYNEKQVRGLIAESWRINYHRRPPNIDEFLTEKWIGDTAHHLYPYIKEHLCNFWDTNSPYRHLLLAPHIGWGKSFMTVLSVLFIIVRIYCMRNPKHFYGLAPSTVMAIILISFTLDKAKEILVQPFLNILSSAENTFHRVRTEEQLVKKAKDNPDIIHYTTAGTSAIQFHNSLNIVLASDPARLLGLSPLAGAMTEVNFFKEKGFSDEMISRIYNDLKRRVYSRYQDKYLATTILDSSPVSLDNFMDKYIFSGEASLDPKNYVVTGAMWEYQPWKFPIWEEDCNKTFPVFRGTASRPPKMLEEVEIPNFNPDEIFHVPIDVKGLFEEDLLRNLRDIAGYPSGDDDKLVPNFSIIEEMFTPRLKNIYKYIFAPADQAPERLIWNQIKDTFFVHLGHGKYELAYHPSEKRYIAVDQSVVNDMTGITMAHPENNENGEIVYVMDFTLNIIPNRKRINLQAIEEFIRDLRKIGGVNIDYISFDQYQSENTIQQLERDNFKVQRLSVDRTMAPYLDFVSLMNNRRVKCGYNIFLKNNIRSLQIVTTGSGKKKVDHVKLSNNRVVEEDGGDWTTSSMGHGSKDLSDSVAAVIALIRLHFKSAVARYMWEDDKEQRELDAKKELTKEDIMNEALKKVRKKFNLVPQIAE